MEHILLVEDEPTNRAILATHLRQAGYTVDEAFDGQAALEMLTANTQYAIVVTDRRMPRMDGLQLFANMKMHKALDQIPVIMQTAATAPEEVVEGIKAGVYYYLAKPYQEETLLTLVKAAIRERRKNEVFESRFQRQREALGKVVKGEFEISTPEEAQNISFLLGGLFPRPELAVTGLFELLLNAVEHGNLGIGLEGKAKLLASSQWEETIHRRLTRPENNDKKVTIQFTQAADRLEVLITDQGPGFDWRPFLEIEPSRATQANGRGIAKANLLSFDRLTYLGKGNQVQVVTRLAA